MTSRFAPFARASFRTLGMLAGIGALAGCAAAPSDDEAPDEDGTASVEAASTAPDPVYAKQCTNWVETKRVNATSLYVRYHTSCPSKAVLLTAQGYTTRNGMVLCARTTNVSYTGSVVTPWCPLWDPAGVQYWGFLSEGSINHEDQIPRYGYNARF